MGTAGSIVLELACIESMVVMAIRSLQLRDVLLSVLSKLSTTGQPLGSRS